MRIFADEDGRNTHPSGALIPIIYAFLRCFHVFSEQVYLIIDLIKRMLYNMNMDMFVALSDPTRRAILEILASRGELTATDIYEHFSVSPQAISQHLKVLREAKLVAMKKRAQKHLYSLNPQTLSQLETWVQQTRQRWEERFEALDKAKSLHI
jgi:DNA-binding transcriptional ArsR family regulator